MSGGCSTIPSHEPTLHMTLTNLIFGKKPTFWTFWACRTNVKLLNNLISNYLTTYLCVCGPLYTHKLFAVTPKKNLMKSVPSNFWHQSFQAIKLLHTRANSYHIIWYQIIWQNIWACIGSIKVWIIGNSKWYVIVIRNENNVKQLQIVLYI